jgi:Ca2+-binding RTX toxin-like protein
METLPTDGNDSINGAVASGLVSILGTQGNDTLNGTQGDDTISSLAGNDSLSGNNGNDLLDGGDGTDTLDGGLGNDSLIGGNGDDTYLVDSDDIITEAANAGIDTVKSFTNFTLGNNLENLILDGGYNQAMILSTVAIMAIIGTS